MEVNRKRKASSSSEESTLGEPTVKRVTQLNKDTVFERCTLCEERHPLAHLARCHECSHTFWCHECLSSATPDRLNMDSPFEVPARANPFVSESQDAEECAWFCMYCAQKVLRDHVQDRREMWGL